MTLLYLNSDRMGQGDDTLGRTLMAAFLEKLLDSGTPVHAVACVNSGVRLTTEGSEVVELLQVLEHRGATVASCATCLDSYGLRDQLVVGEVGSMPQTVAALATADRVIQP